MHSELRRAPKALNLISRTYRLFIVVGILAVLAAVLWPCRHTLRSSVGSFFREQRGTWLPVAVISAVFAFPILVNLALNWPGDFGKYISYGGSGRAGGHSLRQVAQYALWCFPGSTFRN